MSEINLLREGEENVGRKRGREIVPMDFQLCMFGTVTVTVRNVESIEEMKAE